MWSTNNYAYKNCILYWRSNCNSKCTRTIRFSHAVANVTFTTCLKMLLKKCCHISEVSCVLSYMLQHITSFQHKHSAWNHSGN